MRQPLKGVYVASLWRADMLDAFGVAPCWRHTRSTRGAGMASGLIEQARDHIAAGSAP